MSAPRNIRVSALSVAAVLCMLGTVTTPAQADTVLGGEALPTKVSSYRGIVAWDSARYIGLERARRIRVQIGDASMDLPIADGAQHVDVGPGPDATPVAVYARCPFESQSPVGAPHYFIYARRPVQPPARCDLYLYDFATGRERKLEGASTGAGSEYLPTVWGERIAFVRVYERRKGRRGVYPYIYVRRIDGRGKSTRIPGGARGYYELDKRSRQVRFGGVGPVGLDLRGDRLAWTWESSPSRSRVTTELRTTQVGRRGRILERATTTGLTAKNRGRLSSARVDALIAPVLTADSIYYARWRNGTGGRYVQRTLRTNRRSSAPGPSRDWQPTSLAANGSTFYYSTLEGQLGTCGLFGGSHVPTGEQPPADTQRCFIRRSAALAFR